MARKGRILISTHSFFQSPAPNVPAWLLLSVLGLSGSFFFFFCYTEKCGLFYFVMCACGHVFWFFFSLHDQV